MLDKNIKLEWHRASNCKTRCLRITQKEEKLVRAKLQNRCERWKPRARTAVGHGV